MALPFQPVSPTINYPVTPAPPKDIPSDISLSWDIGWEQMRGVPAWMQGAGASLLEKAGFEEAAASHRLSASEMARDMALNIAEMESLYGGPSSWEEARADNNIGAYALWGINEAVKQVPNLTSMALGALVTGGVGAALGRFAVGRALAKLPFAGGKAGQGASVIGVGLSSAILNTGEIYSSALLDTGENNPGITGMAGIAAGMFDMWPGSKVVRAMGRGPDLGSWVANKFLKDKKWRRRLYRSLELAATEGMVEDIQTVIEAMTVNYLNDNDLAREYVDKAYGLIPITADQVSERMNARAAGGLIGGVLGFPGRTGVGGIGRRGRRIKEEEEKRREELTKDDMRDMDDALGVSGTVTWEEGPGEVLAYPGGPPGVPGGPFPTPARRAAEAREAALRNRAAEADRILEEGGLVSPDTRRGMDPFSTSVPDDDGYISWGDATSRAAGTVTGIKPRKVTNKQIRKAQARVEKARRKVESSQRNEASMARLRTEFGLPGAGVVAPTGMTREDETLMAAEQKLSDLQAAQAAFLNEKEGSKDFTDDVDVAIWMLGEEAKENAALRESTEMKELQKEALLLKYNEINLEKATKEDIHAILPDAWIELSDLGVKSNVSKGNLISAIEEFLGDVLLAHQVAVEEDTITAAREADAKKMEKVLRIVAMGGPEGSVVRALLAETGIPGLADEGWLGQNSIVTLQREIDARVKLAEAEFFRRVERSEEARKEGIRTKVRVRREIIETEARGEVFRQPYRKEKVEGTLALKEPKKRKTRAQIREGKEDITRDVVVEGKITRKVVARAEVKGPILGKEAIKKEVYVDEAVATVNEEVMKMVDEEMGADVKPAAVRGFAAEEEYQALVTNAFRMSDGGYYFLLTPSTKAEGKTGSVFRLLKKIYPEGEQFYSLEAYEEAHVPRDEPFGGELDLDPKSETFGEMVDLKKSITKIKEEIAIRRIAKRKNVWPTKGLEELRPANWEEMDAKAQKKWTKEHKDLATILKKYVSQAEIDSEIENVLLVSPAGTYMVYEKPSGRVMYSQERFTKADQTAGRGKEGEVKYFDEEGNLTTMEFGNPKWHFKKLVSGELGAYAKRYITYDKSDQPIFEQFVDDVRNFALHARLETLKRKYKEKKDIPMWELAKVAREFEISTGFIGISTAKGRARFVEHQDWRAAFKKDEEGEVTAELTDESAAMQWFQPASKTVERNYIALNGIPQMYEDFEKSVRAMATPEFMAIEGAEQNIKDEAWELAVDQAIKTMQQDAAISREEIANANLGLEESELVKLYQAAGVIFTEKEVKAIRKLANDNRVSLTDPKGATTFEIPKGKIADPIKVYDSLRNSVSQGTGAVASLISESKDSFISRSSEPHITTREITKGTKVTLNMGAWQHVIDQPTLKTLLGEKVTPTRLRALVEELIKLRAVQKEIRKYGGKNPRAIKIAKRITPDAFALSLEKRKEIIEPQLAMIRSEIVRVTEALEQELAEFMNATYNVIGQKDGKYILEVVGRKGQRFVIDEKYFGVVKFSEESIERLQQNALYAENQKTELKTAVAQGRLAKLERFEGLGKETITKRTQDPLKREISEIARENLRRKAIQTVDAKLAEERKALEKQTKARRAEPTEEEAAAGEKGKRLAPISPENYQRKLSELEGSRTIRIYREMQNMSYLGKPLIQLPKAWRERARESGWKPGEAVEKYVASIEAQLGAEPRIVRIGRVSRERGEERDWLTMQVLRTPKRGWRPYTKELGSRIREVDAALTTGPLNIWERKKLYAALKNRYREIESAIAARRLREVVQEATVEEDVAPDVWGAAPYKFVKVSDLPELFKPRFAGHLVKGAPVQRWKNAYGAMIDKLKFRWTPAGETEETSVTVYEAVDPYFPDNVARFETLEEARNAFGKKYYKEVRPEMWEEKSRFRWEFEPAFGSWKRIPKVPSGTIVTDGRPSGVEGDVMPATTQGVVAEAELLRLAEQKKFDELRSRIGKMLRPRVARELIARLEIPEVSPYPQTRIVGVRREPAGLGISQIPTYEKYTADPTTDAVVAVYKRMYEKEVLRGIRPSITLFSITDKRGVVWTRADKKSPWMPDLAPRPAPEVLNSLVLEGEYTSLGFPHLLIAKKDEPGSTRDAIMDRLSEAFGRQIFQTVRVVQSYNDLPLSFKNARGEADVIDLIRAVTYNSEIWLVADNISEDRIVAVVLHELGGHGMKAVMGDRFYQKLMAQIAVLVNEDSEMAGIYNTVKRNIGGTNEALWLEETMGYTIENEAMQDNTFWRAIVDAILYALARLKLWVNPKWVGSGDILVFAKAAAKRHAALMKNSDVKYSANFLGTFLYSGEFGKNSSEHDRASGLVGALDDVGAEHMDRGYIGDWFIRDTPPPRYWWESFIVVRDVTRREGRKEFNRPVLGKRIRKLGPYRFQLYAGHNIKRWIVNYFTIIDDLVNSIRLRGGIVTDDNNPSLSHGAYKNKVNFLRRDFHREMVDPLRDYMKEHRVDGDDLMWYLYADHAPHRNRVRQQEALKRGLPNASGIWSTKEEAKKAFEEMGGVQISAEGEMERLETKLGVKYVDGVRQESKEWGHLVRAGEYVRAINKENLRRQLETGMLTEEIMMKSEMYMDEDIMRTYVPLRGENIVMADEFFEVPIGPGKIGVSGPESKAAKGRVTVAENVWAWSIMQMDYEIDRIEKNTVVKTFARLIQDNEGDLKDFAHVAPLEEYKKHEYMYGPQKGKLILGMYPQQQTDPNHNIHFKNNGEEYVVIVKDKRIGQAFNRTNMTDSGTFLQLASQVNRYFSAIHTSINPEFVITNFVKDFQTAMGHLQGLKETVSEFEDTEALGRKVFKNIKNAAIGMKMFVRDKRSDTEWSANARELSEQGGRIDFFAFKDVRDFEKTLNNYIKDTTAAGMRRWKDKMLDFVGEYNAVVENTMRLATYVTARDEFISNGMTVENAKKRAADIARNLTVNFSQKGEKAAALNSLYLFFNASVQGTVRLFQAMFARPFGKKGRRFTRVQKIVGGIMLYSFSQAILNAMLAGDDEDGVNRYRQIDLRTRGRQAHIYLPGFDTFLKIPLPYGYNIFHAIGDTLASLMMGHTTPGRATMHVMSSAAESFMPVAFGSSDNLFAAALQTVSPTITDPFVDLALNENYFGQPIYKDPVWGSSDPPSERYWGSTGPTPKIISRALNALTGGSRAQPGWMSVPPDIWEYFWETLGGGAGRFVERSTDLVWAIGPGRLTHRDTGDIIWTKVPFGRRFFFDETASKNRFVYDKYSEYESMIRSAEGMNTGIVEIYGRGKEYNNFKESPDYKLFRLADELKSTAASITELQKRRNQINKNKVLRNNVKEDRINRLNDQMADKRVRFIKKVDDVLGS